MRKITVEHSYEELRSVVVDILVGREKTHYPPEQYASLVSGVAEVLAKRGSATTDVPMTSSPAEIRLRPNDVELVRDVFWDLFRQGFITLGLNDNNDKWPWFRLTQYAKNTLAEQSPYRFHDTGSYIALVRKSVPDISGEAVRYLEEAVATFYADCLLAACVMLGVAAEIEFLRLIAVGVANRTHSATFSRADKERTIRQKILKFQNGLTTLPQMLRDQAGEDLDTHLTAIQSILRIARNEAGHATISKQPTREQVYVYLQLLIPFAEQVRRLRLALGA
jgi:hypothetical protein